MKIIANCASYNDYKDVLFMMDSDDYRLSDPDYGYTKISDGEYHKNLRKFITSDGVIYTVFMDWSVKKVQDRN
jgi:hypothetical protein